VILIISTVSKEVHRADITDFETSWHLETFKKDKLCGVVIRKKQQRGTFLMRIMDLFP
jgi:hypothetical protein